MGVKTGKPMRVK